MYDTRRGLLLFYRVSDIQSGAAAVEDDITGSLLQLGNIVLMIASSLAVPIRNLLGGDAVKHSLVCVLMLLSNSAVPRIDLILRDSVENSLIPMLVSLLFSSVPLCLSPVTILSSQPYSYWLLSLADSGLHHQRGAVPESQNLP